jgi:AraC-like DNA-binding protein
MAKCVRDRLKFGNPPPEDLDPGTVTLCNVFGAAPDGVRAFETIENEKGEMCSRSSEFRKPPPEGVDPLVAVLTLLRPKPLVSNSRIASGRWRVRYRPHDDFSFCLVLGGRCFIESDDLGVLILAEGDFALLLHTACITLASDLDPEPTREGPHGSDSSLSLSGRFRVSRAAAPSLVRLLPPLVHIRREEPGAYRIRRIVDAVTEEAHTEHPGRQLVLERLLDVLLVEALRFRPSFVRRQRPGLLLGLSDAAVAHALRQIHDDVTRDWTVAELAHAANMSRAEFAERFVSKVVLPPVQYHLEWRMAMARDMLARERLSRNEVAARVGYHNASAFSTAFMRVVGCSPSEFARSNDSSR